jgi:hypothetical protein
MGAESDYVVRLSARSAVRLFHTVHADGTVGILRPFGVPVSTP